MTNKTTNTTLKNRSFIGPLWAFLVLCAWVMLLSQGALAQAQETRPRPKFADIKEERDANLASQTAPARFLFLYREGTISAEEVKRFAERAELLIKTKSTPPRLAPGAQKTDLEQMTLEDLGTMLFFERKGSETARETEKKDEIASGAKLTKADAARKAKSPTLGELFQKHGAVLVFNLCCTESESTGERVVLPAGKVDKQKSGGSENGPGPCPRPISPSCVELYPRPPFVGEPFCMCLLDLDVKPLGGSSRTSSPGTSPRLIVITFNQTPETQEEFKQLFCTLYHGDCGGPIGKPTPLPDPVNVRKYVRMDWNGPIKDERTLLAALQKGPIAGAINVSNQPQQYIACMRRDVQGNCNWWRICGNLGPKGEYRCYDIINFGPGIGWQVAW